MSVGHQSPQSTLPPLALNTLNTTTWGAGGTTCTITDPYVHTNSWVDVGVTGSTPQNGYWALTITQGQILITSSNAESSTLPISYVVL